jgi:hypothetical protein
MLRILRVVGSRSLQCGCFVGVYETYTGATVEIVEERGPRCPERSHDEGQASRVVGPEGSREHQHVAA